MIFDFLVVFFFLSIFVEVFLFERISQLNRKIKEYEKLLSSYVDSFGNLDKHDKLPN